MGKLGSFSIIPTSDMTYVCYVYFNQINLWEAKAERKCMKKKKWLSFTLRAITYPILAILSNLKYLIKTCLKNVESFSLK